MVTKEVKERARLSAIVLLAVKDCPVLITLTCKCHSIKQVNDNAFNVDGILIKTGAKISSIVATEK